jgi:hypothetical protein
MSWSIYPLWDGGGNNLESILSISPMADLRPHVSPLQDAGMQLYETMYFLLRVQGS